MMISFIRWEISFSDQSGTIYRTSVMNNYFGIGLDAAIALDFHNAREENPDKFNSRCVCMLASDVFITMVTQVQEQEHVLAARSPEDGEED